ncbi:MAG: amidohydrolase [Anaerolineae bacterium]
MNPTLILHNAKIYTVDPTRPWAGAVACTGGTITAVGDSADILPLAGPKTVVIDAGGKLVLPGLTDSHVHFLQYAIRRHQVSLFGLADISEALARVRQAADHHPAGLWLQGWGWNEHHWDTPPTAALLDTVAPDVPVALARMDMHTWWVNSAALKLAGITRHTPDPPEARIERDSDGNPTGLLREWNAIALVERHIGRPDNATLRQWLAEAITSVHRLGLTAIHDQRVEREGRQSLRLLQSLRRDGQLKLRVHANIAADFLPEAATLGLQPGFGDDLLWLGHVKAFADGTMGSQTAWMLAPFEGSAENTGIVVTPMAELGDLADRAAQAGFSLSVHAIGDRAVREVAAVLSEFPPNAEAGQLPHRIEHVQIIHPDDLATLARHNIYASVQPVHLHTDWPTADKVWGERARYAYAFASLLAQGTPLALGSDAPVAPINPMLSIHAALTRQDERNQPANGWHPAERIGLPEIIHGFTLAPARLAGKAARQGSVTMGKWADLVILNQNLFEIDPAEVKDVTVDATVFNGELVYRAG